MSYLEIDVNQFRNTAFSVFMIGCSVLLSGCGNPHWLDKYGEKLCVAVEQHRDLIKSVQNGESLKTKRGEIEASVKAFDALEQEAVKYSYQAAKDNPSTKTDQEKLARLAKRLDDALDSLVIEVERIEGFVTRGQNADTDQMIIAATRVFENPLNPQRKRWQEQADRQRKRNVSSTPSSAAAAAEEASKQFNDK